MPCTLSHAAILGVALMSSGCHPLGTPPTIQERLQKLEKAIGTTPSSGARYLRYAVDGDQGHWVHEVVASGDAYAERRVRDDGRSYVFGRDPRGAWLATDGREPVAVDAAWEELARTQEVLLGAEFTRPGPGDEVEYMGRSGRTWDFTFRPEGGRTVTFTVDRPTSRPRSYDVVDDFGRLLRCDELRWDRSSLASALCSSADRWGHAARRARARLRLETSSAIAPRAAPEWARAPKARPSPRTLPVPVEFAIGEPRRVHLPVRFGDGPARDFVLDSGAFHTVVSADAASEMGVVPTGEPPLFATPPWLAQTKLWVGVVDRMRVGDAEVFGERVLVAENRRMLGGDAGLLGASFFRRFIVDVDSPASKVRVAARDGYRPTGGVVRMRLAGEGADMGVEGEVVGVAKGLMVLDTGMPEDVLVHAWQMAVKHPRERGRDAFLGGQPDALHSPDYYSHVEGLQFGPFRLPRMDALGRDRWREDVGGGVALIGMGVMRYFRLCFDLRDRLLYVWPGDAYSVLRRAGMDVEEGSGSGPGPGRPVLERVVERGSAERAGLRRGDEIVQVGGKPVTDVGQARHRIAAHPISGLKMLVLRRGRLKSVVLDLASPDVAPLGP